MPDSVPGVGLVRWMLWPRPTGPPIIVLVVDDGDDRELSAVLARDELPSTGFSGEWGTGQRDGRWLVGFRLFKPGDGFERLLITDNVHHDLLEAILDVPHVVAILARAIAGEAKTATAIAARFGESLTVEVEHRSTHVAHVLAPHGATDAFGDARADIAGRRAPRQA